MSVSAPQLDGLKLVEELAFPSTSGTELLLDLVLPEHTDGTTPAVVYVHGGGWARGNRRVDLERRIAGVARQGIGVATIEHRLGPEGRFPHAVHDVVAAVAWLRSHGGEHGLATERVGAWGSSSGAHLCLMAALSHDPEILGGPDHGGIDAVVDFFATSDLPSRAARSRMESRMVQPGPEAAFLGLEDVEDPTEKRRRAWAASPISLVHGEAPPALIIHGQADQLVPFSQSQRLHDALIAVGAKSTLVSLGDAGHEDAAFDQPFVQTLVAAFLRDMLAGEPSTPRGSE